MTETAAAALADHDPVSDLTYRGYDLRMTARHTSGTGFVPLLEVLDAGGVVYSYEFKRLFHDANDALAHAAGKGRGTVDDLLRLAIIAERAAG